MCISTHMHKIVMRSKTSVSVCLSLTATISVIYDDDYCYIRSIYFVFIKQTNKKCNETKPMNVGTKSEIIPEQDDALSIIGYYLIFGFFFSHFHFHHSGFNQWSYQFFYQKRKELDRKVVCCFFFLFPLFLGKRGKEQKQ